MPLKFKFNSSGFTLIEGMVGLAVFAVFAAGIYGAFTAATRLMETSRLLISSAALANEEFEIAHNLPYASVGIVSGLPAGKIPHLQNITRDNFNFQVETTVRSIDDPFDGTLGGAPNDTSPADYKLMEVKITVPNNARFPAQIYTEYIAPKNLENSTANGALFIRVFDANGQPVSQANVHIANTALNPPIIIDDTTNDLGVLEIVDVPPSVSSYSIMVSKPGYSSDQTYPPGAPGNPNPNKPDATVVAQQVTQTSFVIDHTSTLNIESVTQTCAPVPNVGFNLQGSKLIGSSPDVLKYDNNFNTGASGAIVYDLEWDTYTLTFTDTARDLAGAISPIPLSLAPGSAQDVKIIATNKNPDSLLISVLQGGTNLPLSGATVQLSRGTTTEQLITGRGFLRQTDWSGGSGQENFIDQTAYSDSDGNIETNNPAGEIKLKSDLGLFAAAGNLTSSAFDTGSASNFYQLQFLPIDQPSAAGANSVRLQLAANNDNSTWNFTGPDGTASSFYTATDTNINLANNGKRYLRYKIYLSTASSTYTPDVGEVNFTFSSLCVPSGQILFTGQEPGNYTLDVS
ncbi:MAG TPA: prepilin-type N-terminal cleavage/methylation domain-containing protein, partial [Candidatus Nanoarchaeia archaeon]|nr:prepilin-type N-terminal cleavage/methylation domain-containing protein [Candidatus Nanoarchaeia archaeon]